jgi:DNA primase catalytic subunit
MGPNHKWTLSKKEKSLLIINATAFFFFFFFKKGLKRKKQQKRGREANSFAIIKIDFDHIYISYY